MPPKRQTAASVHCPSRYALSSRSSYFEKRARQSHSLGKSKQPHSLGCTDGHRGGIAPATTFRVPSSSRRMSLKNAKRLPSHLYGQLVARWLCITEGDPIWRKIAVGILLHLETGEQLFKSLVYFCWGEGFSFQVFDVVECLLDNLRVISRMFCSLEMSCPPREIKPPE